MRIVCRCRCSLSLKWDFRSLRLSLCTFHYIASFIYISIYLHLNHPLMASVHWLDSPSYLHLHRSWITIASKSRPKGGKGKEIQRARSPIKWHVKPPRADGYTVPSACNKEHGEALRKGFYSFHFVDRCRKNKIWNDWGWENPAENREAGGHQSYHQTSERLPDEEKDERMTSCMVWNYQPTYSGSKLLATGAETLVSSGPALYPKGNLQLRAIKDLHRDHTHRPSLLFQTHPYQNRTKQAPEQCIHHFLHG